MIYAALQYENVEKVIQFLKLIGIRVTSSRNSQFVGTEFMDFMSKISHDEYWIGIIQFIFRIADASRIAYINFIAHSSKILLLRSEYLVACYVGSTLE
jgi:hypothetical protein